MCFDHTGTYASFAYYSVSIYSQRRERGIETPSYQRPIAENLRPNHQEEHGAICRLKTQYRNS